MAVEIAVIPNTAMADGSLVRAGDILVAVLAGHRWTSTERKKFIISDYPGDDAKDLEARVVAAGGVLAYPFAVTVDAPTQEQPTRKLMTAISSKAVDLAGIPNASREVTTERSKVTSPVIIDRDKA